MEFRPPPTSDRFHPAGELPGGPPLVALIRQLPSEARRSSRGTALARMARSSPLMSWRRAARKASRRVRVSASSASPAGEAATRATRRSDRVDSALQQARLLQAGRDAGHRRRGDALDGGQFAERQLSSFGQDRQGGKLGRRDVTGGLLAQTTRQAQHCEPELAAERRRGGCRHRPEV